MKLSSYGTAQAQRDFHKGGWSDSNPYPPLSRQYIEWDEEMKKLVNMELNDVRAEVQHA